jgi:hypothetical protein
MLKENYLSAKTTILSVLSFCLATLTFETQSKDLKYGPKGDPGDKIHGRSQFHPGFLFGQKFIFH